MSAKHKGLGRGLDALLGGNNKPPEAAQDALTQLDAAQLKPGKYQPRTRMDEASLAELADSIKARGVIQPIIVRAVGEGKYEILAGERRWRAARLAGFETIPGLVRPNDDAVSLELALIENMAREDLSPVEEARACALLVDELGLTREAIGRRVGRSRVSVSNLLRLLDLPEEALELLAGGDLSEGHGRALLAAPGHDERRRLARAAAAEGWTVRETEARARDAVAAANRVTPGRRSGRAAAHADQAEAADRLSEVLSRTLGADVRVTARGSGFRVSLAFDSLDEALALAERLGALEPA
jgi:ParB family chromosome partitioning protein